MKNLIFLDLETTGLDTNTCEVIEACVNIGGEVYTELYKPNFTIPFEISGITNIDNDDVAECGSFQGSDIFMYLQDLMEDENYIIVTHNNDFDLEVLKSYGIEFKNSICTLMLAKKLLPDLGSYKLGTLRAYFGISHDGLAHRAEYDVNLLQQVFERLVDLIIIGHQSLQADEVYNFVLEASNQAKIEFAHIWSFGKYKGQQIDVTTQLDYILWNLNKNENLQPVFRKKLQSLIQLCPNLKYKK